MIGTVSLANDYTGTNSNVNVSLSGLLVGTASDLRYGTSCKLTSGLIPAIGTISLGTTGGTNSTAIALADGLWHFQLTSGTSYDTPVSIWHYESELARFDELTYTLHSLVVEALPPINAAWRQFAAACGYTVGTILPTDVVIGDMRDPPEGRVTICIVNPSEDDNTDGVALGDFKQTFSRTIRGYMDLQEDNETDSRETERERLRDTLRSAIFDVLIDRQYEEVTDARGWQYWGCRPTTCDTGEVAKKRKFYWAFEIEWIATTQGNR